MCLLPRSMTLMGIFFFALDYILCSNTIVYCSVASRYNFHVQFSRNAVRPATYQKLTSSNTARSCKRNANNCRVSNWRSASWWPSMLDYRKNWKSWKRWTWNGNEPRCSSCATWNIISWRKGRRNTFAEKRKSCTSRSRTGICWTRASAYRQRNASYSSESWNWVFENFIRLRMRCDESLHLKKK